MVTEFTKEKMTIKQAKSRVCQEIVLTMISNSPFRDKVTIKGGVVMFTISQNIRRTTIDLDFDFIKYDISEESIRNFISVLNESSDSYFIKIKNVTKLHQDDYEGKRLFVEISDKTAILDFKIDIGVHVLLSIEQQPITFSLDSKQGTLVLKANPLEQVFAEKLFSLVKHGALSSRFKDIFDMYYLIVEKKLSPKLVKQCINLFILRSDRGVRDIDDVCQIVFNTFSNNLFYDNYQKTNEKWVDADYKTVTETILNFIYSI